MRFRAVNAKTQQALLFGLTALALLVSAYLVLRKFDFEGTGTALRAGVPATAAAVFLVGSVLTFFNERAARKIAFLTACATGIVYLVQLCFILLWFPPAMAILQPVLFLMLFLPGLLVWLTLRYARSAGLATDGEATVWRWLRGSTVTLVVALAFGLLLIYVAGKEVAIVTTTATHLMTWETMSDSHCAYRVELAFEAAPANRLDICSRPLWEQLQAGEPRRVEMQWLVDYSLGTWHYRLERVGSWQAPAGTIPRLYFTCSSSGVPPCEGSDLPLAEPYAFR